MELRNMIMISLFCNTYSSSIVNYNIDKIKCINVPHKWDYYYSIKPCQEWLSQMKLFNPPNMIQCIEAMDGDTGQNMHGCKPALGGPNDYISVKYQFTKINPVCRESWHHSFSNFKDCDLRERYDITAFVSRVEIIHPLFKLFLVILLILVFILSCIYSDNNNYNNNFSNSYAGAFWGSYLNNNNYRQSESNWSWSHDN